MEPMDEPDASWWSKGLFSPSSSGSQNDVRYAFFPDKQRLAVEQDVKAKQHDTGDHRISGVSQSQGGQGGKLRFTSQNGDADLASLREAR